MHDKEYISSNKQKLRWCTNVQIGMYQKHHTHNGNTVVHVGNKNTTG